MSASRHVNPAQLKMFMSPNELWAADYTPNENVPARKVEESKDTGLYHSVEKYGVEKPISLHTPPTPDVGRPEPKMVINGHHRLFSQNAIDPDRLMPVLHHESYFSALHSDHRSGPYYAG